MKSDLNFYSRVYDNFLEPQMCDEYIKLYEETLDQEADLVKEKNLCYTKEGEKICEKCTCQRVNTMEHNRFESINKLMIPKFQSAVEKYKVDCKLNEIQFPKKHEWEEFKVKRYLVSDDIENAEQFKYHVDVTDHATA